MKDLKTRQKKMFQFDEKNLDSFLLKQKKLFSSIGEGIEINYLPEYENLVNYKNASSYPIQRWFSYREGYASKLVSDFIDQKNITGNIFDPFCGSGSTLLAARQDKLPSVGIDINPYSTLIASTSNQSYNDHEKKMLCKTLNYFKELKLKESSRKIDFNLIQKVFNKQILNSLLCIRDEIETIQNNKIKDLFFATWLSILEEVSNIKKEGNGIKYLFTKRTKKGYVNLDQKKWEKSYFPDDKFRFVKDTFTSKLAIIIKDIHKHYGSTKNEPTIITGNCLTSNYNEFENFQLTYFSPPYCNAFDYFEIHKVELWMGEFVKNRKELLTLKRSGFRSNTTSLGEKNIYYTNNNINSLTQLLNSRDLWDKRLPNVVAGYFDDMYTLLSKIYTNTKKGGYVAIVVGNSAYSGCIIPTDILISDLSKRIGFKLSNIAKVRHLTTSSQQKKYLNPLKNYLRESIIVLKK